MSIIRTDSGHMLIAHLEALRDVHQPNDDDEHTIVRVDKRARRESYQTAIDELRARLPQIEEDAATLFFREIGAVFNGSAVAR